MNLKKKIVMVATVFMMVAGLSGNVFAKDNASVVKFTLDSGEEIQVEVIEHNYLGTIEVNLPIVLGESLDKTQYEKTKIDVIRRTGDNDPIVSFKLLKGGAEADSVSNEIRYYGYNNGGADNWVLGDYKGNYIDGSGDKISVGYHQGSGASTLEGNEIKSSSVILGKGDMGDCLTDMTLQYYKNNESYYYIKTGKILMLSENTINKFLSTGEIYKGDASTWKESNLKEILTGKSPVSTTKTNTSNEKAIKTSNAVIVDGKKVNFEAYSINDSNYLKLRDLAYAINGSSKEFNIVWDNAKNAISIISKTKYSPQGGEMSLNTGNKTAEAVISNSKVYIDGKEAVFTAYNINSSTYFKLRDIAQVLNISIGWSEEVKTITLDTHTK
jgi:hypothetical protein